MSLSEQIERVDGSQNTILKALANSYGISTDGKKIDEIAAEVVESPKFGMDSLLSAETAALFGLGADAVPDDALSAINTLISNVQNTANSRAQIVTGSYVGTGTYGASNPCSLTFDFPPKLFCIFSSTSISNTELNDVSDPNGAFRVSTINLIVTSYLTTNYRKSMNYLAFAGDNHVSSRSYIKKSADGKTIFWYNIGSNSTLQFNAPNTIYWWMVM